MGLEQVLEDISRDLATLRERDASGRLAPLLRPLVVGPLDRPGEEPVRDVRPVE